MTRKHYIAIAEQLTKAHSVHKDSNAHQLTAELLANYFYTDNKNFDRERFLTACGVEETEDGERLVRCTSCMWQGVENQLHVELETEHCPDCNRGDCLMDII